MFLDLLKQELGDSKPAGYETRFCCPFCGESKHKFYVHSEKGLWICFKCEEKGNPVSFVTQYYNVTFPEAVDILATYEYDVENERDNSYKPSQYGSDLSEEEQLLLFISREGQPYEEEKQAINFTCPPPPTNCKPLIDNFENPEAFPFFQYLHNRGVNLEQIKAHYMSYVTYGNVSLPDGREMNLVNHLVFYTFDSTGKAVYWNTRSIDPNPFIKSFNAPSRETEYSKNNTIFNLNRAKFTDRIVVTEGVFNALAVGDSGVATFGKMVTDEQVRIMLEETKDRKLPIYLFLDTDAWERMIDAANRIRKTEPDRKVYYVFTGTDEDANDLGHERSWEYINNAIFADGDGEIKLRLLNM